MSMIFRVFASSVLLVSSLGLSKANGRVVQLLENSQLGKGVYLDIGTNDGIHNGSLVRIYRKHDGCESSIGEKVETGRAKVVSVNGTSSYAKLLSSGSVISKVVFPRFPEVMAEDCTEILTQEISRNQKLLPTETVSYFDIFVDPKQTPLSFELTDEGKERLKEVAENYASARVSLLMIEGHTDTEGPSDANQVESTQRARTVREYLVNELGFDADRVVAVGFGESEPAQLTYVNGYKRANRRVVFRVGQ